jgi:hypothetical protein
MSGCLSSRFGRATYVGEVPDLSLRHLMQGGDKESRALLIVLSGRVRGDGSRVIHPVIAKRAGE